MVETIIKPKQTHVKVEFDLPEDFIGRDVKVTFSTVEETPPRKVAKWGDFWGILSDESAEGIREEIKKIREEWD